MSLDLRFGWAEPGDLAEVEAFHASRFGPGSVQAVPGRVAWLYFANPLGLHMATCRDGARLVATCGHLPQVVSVDGETVLAGFGIDFMVDPEYRRCGIGRRFLAMRLERFRLSLSTGQSPAMRALYDRAGGVVLGPIVQGVHRRRPPTSGGPKDLAKGWAAWVAGLGGVRPRQVAESANWVEVAYRAAFAARDERAGAWLRWRCDGPVYGDHRALRFGHGAAAVRREGDLQIVTALAAAPRERAALLAAVAHHEGVAETRASGAGRAFTHDLRRAGYLVRPTAAVVVAATLDDDLRRRLVPGALDLDAAAGDADLLRRP